MKHGGIDITQWDTASKIRQPKEHVKGVCCELPRIIRGAARKDPKEQQGIECDLPGKASYERHELVQIARAYVTQYSTEHNRRESKQVLLPLHTYVAFATATE